MQMYDTSIPVEGGRDLAYPKFYMEPVLNEKKTAEAGRNVFDDVEMVRICVPGDKLLEVVSQVMRRHKNRWPQAYKAWKEGQEAPLSGTPISEWPLVSRSRCEELASMGIRTVEALADIADGNIPRGSGITELKQKARNWLEKSKDNSILTRMEARLAALEKENAALKADKK